MKLYIKNMVCDRCIMAVEDTLQKSGLHFSSVTLGEAYIEEDNLTKEQTAQVAQSLQVIGFELIDKESNKIAEKIKNVIIQFIHHSEGNPKHKYSDIIARELDYDYPYLSKLFSDEESITIEQYIINQKIEKVKELIQYNELSLTDIAGKVGYSSPAHLSTQFKKVIGTSPAKYREMNITNRIGLDKVGIHK